MFKRRLKVVRSTYKITREGTNEINESFLRTSFVYAIHTKVI